MPLACERKKGKNSGKMSNEPFRHAEKVPSEARIGGSTTAGPFAVARFDAISKDVGLRASRCRARFNTSATRFLHLHLPHGKELTVVLGSP